MRDQVGVDRIMWGSDYPHLEGCWPFSRQHLRLAFAGRPRGRGPAAGRAQRRRRLRLRLAAARTAGRRARSHPGRGRRAPGARGHPRRVAALPGLRRRAVRRGMSCARAGRHLRPPRGGVRRVALRPVPPPARRGPGPPLRAAAGLGRHPLRRRQRHPARLLGVVGHRQRGPDPVHGRRDRAPRLRPPGRAHAGAARRPRPRPAAQARWPSRSGPARSRACASWSRSGCGRGSTSSSPGHGTGTPVELDLIADFAYPLPVEIFCQMLGIPEEDHPVFRFWVNCIARSLDPVMDPAERDELDGRHRRHVRLPRGAGGVEAGAGRRRHPVGPHPRRGGRRDAHPRGAARPDHDPVRGRPRADRRPGRQRHAGPARLPRPVGGAAGRPVAAAQRRDRAAALRRPQPVRPAHRHAGHDVRDPVGSGHHPGRLGGLPVARLGQPRRGALGAHGRRGRHHPRGRRPATCSSAPASTPASGRTWPACRPR